MKLHVALAVVNRINRTEILQVRFDRVVILKIRICKGCAGVDKADRLRPCIGQLIVVDHDATNLHLKVLSLVQNVNPLQSLFISIQKVSRRIPTTHLEVATILAKTHRELPLLDNVLLHHRIINWLVKVFIRSGFLLAQPKDPISFLTIEILCLCMNTTESVIKHVNSILKVLSKVN